MAAVNAKYIHSNLAVYSLRAYAASRGYGTEIAEYTINQSRDEILRGIYRKQPQVLCFSCYIWNISLIRDLISDLHKILPDLPIWVGGPEVSFDAVRVLRENPGIKGVMRGEGEETFAELAAWYAGDSRGGLEGILGLTWRTQTGGIRANDDRPVMDLSSIPFPYRETEEFAHRILYYESSRGCPFSCSYCLSSIDKRLRFRNMELVEQELQFFLDRNVKQVKFVDRTFNCKKEHAMAVWRYLAAHDNGVTNFHFEIAADLLDGEELELLGGLRPGQIQLEIGVQSTNPETVREIHRKMDFSKVAAAVGAIAGRRNIHQHLDLIAGLPLEGYASFRRSFQAVYALHPQQLQLGFLKVLKGSHMAEHAGDYGVQYREREPYEVLSTRWLSYAEILRLKTVEEMVEIYYNSGQFARILERAERLWDNMFDFFAELGGYYEAQGAFAGAHSRLHRYELLLGFLTERHPELGGEFAELCVLDVYARENSKSRPSFAADDRIYREQIRAFFQREERLFAYLPRERYEAYDWKQMMRLTHIEVTRELGGRRAFLFDYCRRDALTGDAACTEITETLFSEEEHEKCVKAACGEE